MSCHSFLNRASHPVLGYPPGRTGSGPFASLDMTQPICARTDEDLSLIVSRMIPLYFAVISTSWRCLLLKVLETTTKCEFDVRFRQMPTIIRQCQLTQNAVILWSRPFWGECNNCQNTGFVDATWSDLCRNCLWFTLDTLLGQFVLCPWFMLEFVSIRQFESFNVCVLFLRCPRIDTRMI
jgi:hypothetical protein